MIFEITYTCAMCFGSGGASGTYGTCPLCEGKRGGTTERDFTKEEATDFMMQGGKIRLVDMKHRTAPKETP